MKRFAKVDRHRLRPRVIDATYRFVKQSEPDPVRVAAKTPAEPLRPVGSFSELAAKAYRRGRMAGSDERLNRIA